MHIHQLLGGNDSYLQWVPEVFPAPGHQHCKQNPVTGAWVLWSSPLSTTGDGIRKRKSRSRRWHGPAVMDTNSRGTITGELFFLGAQGWRRRTLRSGDAVNQNCRSLFSPTRQTLGNTRLALGWLTRRPVEPRIVYGHSPASWLSFLWRSWWVSWSSLLKSKHLLRKSD